MSHPLLLLLRRHLMTLTFLGLLLALQYPLWLGKRGWLHIWDMRQKAMQQIDELASKETRNRALAAEVRDLKSSYEGIEERARFEQGLIRADETFIAWDDPSPEGSPPPSPATP